MTPFSTNPDDWFLSNGDLPSSRRDSSVSTYTSNNLVEPLVDGQSYMRELHDLIQRTGPGDYIFLSAWQLDRGQWLIPPNDDSRVDRVFRASHDRDVKLRLMLSFHPDPVLSMPANMASWLYYTNRDLREGTNVFNPVRMQCILDARTPGTGSAHQKFAVVKQGDTFHAFCGGIDLGVNRWDTIAHDSPPGRQFAGTQAPGGWHDVQCHIRGPACRDLDLSFRERWNDRRRPSSFSAPPPEILTTEFPLASAPADVGSHHVQVLRTYACDAGYPFAPQGEFTGRDAYLKAISLASDYVYIEDQYFVSYEIADALSTALRTHPSLHVIVVLNGTCPYPGANRIFYYHNNEIFNQIRIAGDDRFAAYYLRSTCGDPRPEIYVHAKVMIVDDVWAYIGAMNCNRRSMTYDAEIGIAVVDATIVDGVCQFARDLRVQLWSEHLDLMGVEDLFLTDLLAGFREWDERADRPDVHATVHSPHATSITQAQYENGWEQIWDVLDPQGICPDEPR